MTITMTPAGLLLLQKQEGCRLTMYEDTVGVPTIGYGHNLRYPITMGAAVDILKNDVKNAILPLIGQEWFIDLDPVRQDVLINMTFNMGAAAVWDFHAMIAALNNKDYAGAATAMLESEWARQVPTRAQVLAQIMRTGSYVSTLTI